MRPCERERLVSLPAGWLSEGKGEHGSFLSPRVLRHRAKKVAVCGELSDVGKRSISPQGRKGLGKNGGRGGLHTADTTPPPAPDTPFCSASTLLGNRILFCYHRRKQFNNIADLIAERLFTNGGVLPGGRTTSTKMPSELRMLTIGLGGKAS